MTRCGEPSWKVHGQSTVALHCSTVYDEFGELAWCDVVVWNSPLGCGVAVRKADGDSTEGAVRQLGVQRVVEAVGVVAAAYLELIVDA